MLPAIDNPVAPATTVEDIYNKLIGHKSELFTQNFVPLAVPPHYLSQETLLPNSLYDTPLILQKYYLCLSNVTYFTSLHK